MALRGAGQWVERTERLDLNQLFDRMTAAELDAYAKDGRLPQWFTEGTGTAVTTEPVPEDANRG